MVDMNSKRVRRLRRLSTVRRWAVLPTIRTQSVAEHSFHVAHIALWLLEKLPGVDAEPFPAAFERTLLYYALIHDETEAITGDIPSPGGGNHALPGKSKEYEKTFGLGTATLDEDQFDLVIYDILKLADLLEAWLFIKEEQSLGNDTLHFSVQGSILNRLHAMLQRFGLHDHSLLEAFVQAYDPTIHPVEEGA